MGWPSVSGVCHITLPPSKVDTCKPCCKLIVLCISLILYTHSVVLKIYCPTTTLIIHNIIYVIYKSWSHGVFRVYTTRESRSEEVCSVYALSQRRGAYTLQTSDTKV